MAPIKFIFIFIFWFVVGNALVAQNTWTLNKCISFSIENNIGLRQMEIQEKMAAEDLKLFEDPAFAIVDSIAVLHFFSSSLVPCKDLAGRRRTRSTSDEEQTSCQKGKRKEKKKK